MKLKRLFTAILSAALTLSLCAMPAMATEGSTATGTTSSKTPTAIDLTKTGSLTIHKYEVDSDFSGSTYDDGEHPATSGKPLNGVTFTLYKVEDDTWLKEYYQGNSTKPVPKVEDYYKDGALLDSSKPVAGTLVTGTDGVGTAIASGLKLGLYLVVETDKPDAVKETTEPFLVSIPMTSVDTTNWLYDVTVNPKNVTTYGAATLKKVGYTGSTQDSTLMNGYTFKLYKWDGAEWKWITKKPLNGQDNMGPDLGALTTNDRGEISVKDLTKGVYAFVETGVNKKQGYILDADTAYVFKLDAEGAMKPADTSDVASSATSFDGAVKTLNYNCVKTATGSTINNLEVINYKPDLTKEAKTRKGDGSTATSTDYAIGDTVPFVLTIKVPENIAKLKTFTVTDKTDKNQLLHTQNVVVTGTKKGETDATTLTATTAYTIRYEPDGSGFTIDFKGTGASLTAINDYAGNTITITYSATLQPGAAVVDGTTLNTVNKNSAELKYSSKTTVDTEPETGDPYTIHEEAAVYTFKAGIHKTNGAGTNLGGVMFDLYKKYDSTTETSIDENTIKYNNETKTFVTSTEATRLGLNDAAHTADKWYKVAKDLTTDATTGIVVVKGLPKGEYKFVETKTNVGYNLLSKPVDADLRIQYTITRGTDTAYDEHGTKTHSVTNTTYKAEAGGDYEYKDIKVVNRKGFTLPVTGGFGTLLFSGIGLLLVLVGVSVLFSLKKKTNRA